MEFSLLARENSMKTREAPFGWGVYSVSWPVHKYRFSWKQKYLPHVWAAVGGYTPAGAQYKYRGHSHRSPTPLCSHWNKASFWLWSGGWVASLYFTNYKAKLCCLHPKQVMATLESAEIDLVQSRERQKTQTHQRWRKSSSQRNIS